MKQISYYYTLFAILTLVIIGSFLAPLVETHFLEGTLLPNKKEGDLEQLYFLAYWFRFCFSFFAALAFWGVTDYVNSKSGDTVSLSLRKLCLYLTLAMAIFALSSLINIVNIFIPDIDLTEFPVTRGITSVLSTINSYFILIAISYFDFGRKNNKTTWPSIKNFTTVLSRAETGMKSRKVLRFLAWLVVVIDLSCLILYPEEANSEKKASFALSLITCLFLGFILFSAFWQRGAHKLAFLSILTSITILLAQFAFFDVFKETPVYPSMKLFFSLYYTAAFVAIIFALEFSYLGSFILEKANDELEKANDELARQKAEYQRFTDFISDIVTAGHAKRFFDATLEKIKKEIPFDYVFGIAIKENEKDEIVYPYIEYMDVNAASDKTKRFLKEETFAGKCIEGNTVIVILDFENKKELQKYNLKARNKKMAGEARSGIFIPLIHPNEEKPFGAITIQHKTPFTEYPEDEVKYLKSIADIFSRIIDLEKVLLPPEVSFVKNIQDAGDSPYHFKGKTTVRVKIYSEADFLLNWDDKDTDKKFALKDVEGFYRESHPFNMMMKGFSHEGTFSCGMVLFAGVAAFEQLRMKKDNPFLQKWNETCHNWDGSDNWAFSGFFRGEFDRNTRKTEERFAAIFSLIQDLTIRKNGNNDSINIQAISCVLDPLKDRKIELTFGINNSETLIKNIKYNQEAVEQDGIGALRHSVASKIVEFDLSLFKGVFTYKISDETNSLTLIFKL